MRMILLISCFIGVTFSAQAQGTLEKIYYSLPEQYTAFDDLEKKKQLVVDMKENYLKKDFSNSFIDENNGYLQRIGYQNTYQLSYWQNYVTSQGDSARLVAVVFGGRPTFLIQKEGKFTPISFDVFETFGVSYFFKEGTSAKTMKPYLNYVKFNLPWKGRNIVAYYEGNYGERDGVELLKGDKIDFVWNNGVFEMGEPYF